VFFLAIFGEITSKNAEICYIVFVKRLILFKRGALLLAKSKKKTALYVFIIFAAAVILFTAVVVVFWISKNREEKRRVTVYENGTVGEFANILNEKYGADPDLLLSAFDCSAGDELTNEKLCCLSVNAIDNNEILTARFAPVGTHIENGSESRFYESMYGGITLENGSSFDALVLARQKKEAENVSLESFLYSDGHEEHTFSVYSEDTIPADLFDDLEDVSGCAREAVLKAVDLGLAPYFYASDTYGFLLQPKKKASERDVKKVLSILSGDSPPDRFDVIEVKNDGREFSTEHVFEKNRSDKASCGEDDPCDEGHAVRIRLCSAPLLYAAKKISEKASSQGAQWSVFFGPDPDGTAFALWYNTDFTGPFCLPLKYCESAPLSFVFSPFELSSPREKLEAVATVLPEGICEEFLNLATDNISGEGSFDIAGISFQFFKRDEGAVLYIGTVYEKEM